MAERRMFAKTIIDSDSFLDMPMSARLLYYDLSMRADDDGFVNSPKKIMKIIGATNDDMNVLILRKFIIPFESGIVVIKHWKIHNYIRNDRYKETEYVDEMAMLDVDEKKHYVLKKDVGIPKVSILDTQYSIDKYSIDKNNNIYTSAEQSSKKETCKKIIDYLNEKTGSKFKESSKTTITKIEARLKEGFTYDDFVIVIDKKVNEWLNDAKMNMYLRPETLFGTKFESYLNQKEIKKKEILPNWLDKTNQQEKMNQEELNELEDMFKEFN